MDIEVLQFELNPCNFKLGDALVRYGELIIECELVYYSPASKVWVRMPERWETKEYKKHYAFWRSKKVSDEFQQTVVKKIFSQYDLSQEKVIALHEEKAKRRRFRKNP